MPNRCLICFLFFIGFAINQVAACPFRTHIPDPDDPARYGQIFFAYVKAAEPVPSIFENSDLTPPYKLTVTEPVTLTGKKFSDKTIEVGPGCGWPPPIVGARALFLVEKESGIVVPVYEGADLSQFDVVISEIKRSQSKTK